MAAEAADAAEEEAGRKEQEAIRVMVATLASKGRYMDRNSFAADLAAVAKRARLNL